MRPIDLRRGLLMLAAIIVGLAGMAKAFDTTAFLEALRGWVLIPAGLALVLALILPAAEVGLALSCVLRVAPRASRAAMILILILMSLGYAIHALIAHPPACGCFGRLSAFQNLESSVSWVLGRNAALIALCVFGK